MEKRQSFKDIYGKTKKEMLVELLEVAVTDQQKAFINHELELLANKANGTKKTNEDNDKLTKVVLEEMAKIGTPVTVTDLLETSEVLKNYIVKPATETEGAKKLTNQKLSAILTKVKDIKVKRTVEKKKSYFSLIQEEGEEIA